MSFSHSINTFNYKKNKNKYVKTDDLKNLIDIKLEKKFIEYYIHKKFIKKYISMPLLYNLNIIENLIYNDKTHIVSIFKDHLIMDDKGDFLKRYYTKPEADLRLPKFFEFYELYSKIFPNYTCIEEGKYFYRNIQQKQKMINTIEKKELEKRIKKNKLMENISSDDTINQKIFSTNIIDSLLNETNEEGIEILFNINKNNIKQEDNEFIKEINILIDKINKGKDNRIKKNNNNYLLNLIKKTNNNKYINKNKNIISNNNSNNENNNINNPKKDIKLNPIAKFFSNISKTKNRNKNGNNKMINLYSNNNYTKINLHHKHLKKNSNLIKLNAMTDRTLLDKLENNYNKIKQKYCQSHKNISQNMSTSTKAKKDISSSKNNLSRYNKKPNSISTSYQNILSNFNDKLLYLKTSKGPTTEMKNMKKEIINNSSTKLYLTSKNNVLNFSSYFIKNKNKKNNFNNNSNIIVNNTNKNNITVNNNYNININYSRNKSIKNITVKKISKIKRNYKDSRNKKLNKNNFSYIKLNSSKKGSIISHTNSILSYNDSKTNSKSKNNSKSNIHNYTNSLFDLSKLSKMKVIKYKKINSRKKMIKENILYNGFKVCNSSRNQKNIINKKSSIKYLTNSKIKNSMSKNNSLQKIGIIEALKDNKKNKIKSIKINNFSKVFNAFINHCNKNKENLKPKIN